MELNSDHVFPRSWYPDSSALNLEKWQIPACLECNREYGKLEEEMFVRLGLCINPNTPETSGLVERARRAIDPSAGKNERDANARLAKRIEILGSVLSGDDIPKSGIYPGLGDRWSQPTEQQNAVTIPARHFRRITEKIVRGIFYLNDGRYVEPPYTVTHYALTETGAAEIEQALSDHGEQFAHEPGIIVRRAVAHEDKTSSFFSIEIWRTFKLYASVDD